VSALGPVDDPTSRAVADLLAARGVVHRPIRVVDRAADWTLLVTSAEHGGKLPKAATWESDIAPYYKRLYDKMSKETEGAGFLAGFLPPAPGADLQCTAFHWRCLVFGDLPFLIALLNRDGRVRHAQYGTRHLIGVRFGSAHGARCNGSERNDNEQAHDLHRDLPFCNLTRSFLPVERPHATPVYGFWAAHYAAVSVAATSIWRSTDLTRLPRLLPAY